MQYLRRILRDHRPSPALVVASIALLVALGGTSVAAVNQLAANSVGTSQLKNNAVTTPKIKNNAVNASKIAGNAVVAAKIASNAVNSAKIANASIQPADLSAAAKTSGPVGPAGPAGPTGPTGPIGPSNAYARFLNGPIVIPDTVTTLASLSIPEAGSFALWAKAAIGTTSGFFEATVTCTLEAGADVDQSAVTIPPDSVASLPLQVVHQFTAAGSANFRCVTDGGPASAAAIKITAIKVGSLVNTG